MHFGDKLNTNNSDSPPAVEPTQPGQSSWHGLHSSDTITCIYTSELLMRQRMVRINPAATLVRMTLTRHSGYATVIGHVAWPHVALQYRLVAQPGWILRSAKYNIQRACGLCCRAPARAVLTGAGRHSAGDLPCCCALAWAATHRTHPYPSVNTPADTSSAPATGQGPRYHWRALSNAPQQCCTQHAHRGSVHRAATHTHILTSSHPRSGDPTLRLTLHSAHPLPY